ncbi:MAG: flagellar hook capping FlgD N-terminal domain-containing protein [Aquabacterium sp.]
MSIETQLFTDAARQPGASDAITGAADGSQSSSHLFTTLLVAQIRNQNPLEPTDPSAFVAQLTQLSQMEALQKMATQSSANAAMFQSLQVIGLGAQVGSDVAVRTDAVTLAQDAVHGSFSLSSPSSQTTLVLHGAGGVEHHIDLGACQAGEVPFDIDPATSGIPAGSYRIEVRTSSDETPAVDIEGQLQSLKLSASGAPVLQVAHIGEVALSSISRFNGRTAN